MFLIKGFILGLLIAVPVGPIGVLCIRRTLEKGRLAGFISGLGAATADALYGAIAAFGLVAISNFLINQKHILGLVGGLTLIYIGTKSYVKQDQEVQMSDSTEPTTLSKDYLSTFLLTLTNPSTIIFFTAFFASIGFAWKGSSTWHASMAVLGVFLGSTLWWLTLSLSVNYFKNKFGKISLPLVNKLSGIAIIFFALMVILDILK